MLSSEHLLPFTSKSAKVYTVAYFQFSWLNFLETFNSCCGDVSGSLRYTSNFFSGKRLFYVMKSQNITTILV